MKLFISPLPTVWNIFNSLLQFIKHVESVGYRLTPKAPIYVMSFAEKLLKIGGSRVIVIKSETPWIKPLMKKGRQFRNFTVRVKPMQAHECHWEVIKMWQAYPQTLHVVTGFVLAGDTWLSHSWLVNFSKRKIIDPRGKGNNYFGWVIDHKDMAEYIKGHEE